MNDNHPLVSVLIPAYNHEKYIYECLDSIANQSYPNIEIIVCDDGSHDNTSNRIKEWISKNQHNNIVALSQKNQGICRTLNKLLHACNGRYVSICASDDMLLPNSIELRVKHMRDNVYLDGIICDAQIIDQSSRVVSQSAMRDLHKASYPRLLSNIKKELIYNWSVVGPTLFAKRELFERVGFYNEKLLIEDRDFYLRCLAVSNISFYPHALALYRVHLNNTSGKNMAKRKIIWSQVALSNINNAHLFHGAIFLFLSSFRIDLFLLENMSFSSIPFVIIIKSIRKLVVKSMFCMRLI